MMNVRRGTMRSVSRRGAALRTALAATAGTCSPRTTPNGSLRGSAGREGASDSVLRQMVGQFQFLDKVVVERWLGCGYSQPLVQAVRGSRLSVMELLEEFPLRAVRAWETGHFAFALVSFCLLWCLGVACGVQHPACTSLGSTVDTWSSRGFGRISAFSTLR